MPGECREHPLRLTLEELDAAQCMYSSIPRIARWQGMHRKWKVQSWYCVLLSDEKSA